MAPPGPARPFRRFDDRDYAPPPVPRKRMMAQGKKAHFLYDLKVILKNTKMDPGQVSSFAETLFARGARVSTEEAKAYVREKTDAKEFTPQEERDIVNLVERYSFWR